MKHFSSVLTWTIINYCITRVLHDSDFISLLQKIVKECICSKILKRLNMKISFSLAAAIILSFLRYYYVTLESHSPAPNLPVCQTENEVLTGVNTVQ